MKRLYVYADFDWLEQPELIGTLSYDAVRGGATYGFSFSNKWLAGHGNVFLGEDLRHFPGQQFTRPGNEIFGCFADALPDCWGRTLLNRREQIAAADEKRPTRRLSSFDYLTGIDDHSRMGGFRFAEGESGPFINSSPDFRIPPLTNIRELMHAAEEVEKSESRHELPEKKWLLQLLRPGTSLGGARPKASVMDETGRLAMAKFPSRKDDYDVGAWEHFCHVMARKAGIDAADARLVEGGNFHILLSRRFDRTPEGHRIHFASALTLLGLTDGDNASTGHGYPDIVDFIISHGADVERNLEELYRRVAFNIIVGNSDDHFRNHGFLLRKDGWVLSPAYDMNPTLSEQQSLLINGYTSDSDLLALLDSSEEYFISKERASQIVTEVRNSMKDWKAIALRSGLSQRDINTFEPRINRYL